MSSNEKSLFTPCRRMGLKRKSVGSTLSVSAPQRIDSSINVVSDSQNAFFRHSGNIILNSMNNSSSSSVDSPQLTLKRPKLAVSRIFTTSNTKEQLQGNSAQIPHHAGIGFQMSRSEDSSFNSNFENELHSELNHKAIKLQIISIGERISLKRTQIFDLESQLINAKKHNLQAMNDLISKWRLGCQQALNELLRERQERPDGCAMVNLLDFLGIPGELVHFSNTIAEFYD